MQSVRSDEELGKRMRQAACEMIGPKATLKNLIGADSPPPVVPHPEILPCWFSKVEPTCRRFGKRTASALALNEIGRTKRTKAMSLSLISAF